MQQGYVPPQGNYVPIQDQSNYVPVQDPNNYVQLQHGEYNPVPQQPVYQQPVYQQPQYVQPVYQPPMGMPLPRIAQMYPGFIPRMAGFDKLCAIPGVLVKQKFMMLQALTGCDQQHKHSVYALDANKKASKGAKLFKGTEKSGFCARQCLTPNCRPFNMEVVHKDYFDKNFDATNFIRFEREFQCTCLCLNRPVMKVLHSENGQNYCIGRLRQPFTCCDLKIEIFLGESDNLKYTIEGDCCQCGVMCQGPCCQEAHLDIKDAFGQVVGSLDRVKASFLQNLFETVANFTVTFPQNANGGERALLVGAAILIDYAYFSRKNQGLLSG